LDWIFALPWGKETADNLDLEHAKTVLDEDHYGLASVKERILDFISVRNLKQDGHAPILCFIGPPGTGKTSLGKSIAKSLGRGYARISLGGVKDEAEIRGHRRTYVGAMPGRFIQAIRKAGSLNPVIIIDELDKIGSDFRGDPSAAMLEVLDPQQNSTFYDNYLGVPFDLSRVMFVATANSLDTISAPLRDRMEIIELSGYTLEEKIDIAKRHLVRQAIKDTGLENQPVRLSDVVLSHLIMSYTKESGVRQCERIIRKLCSKLARGLVETKKLALITMKNIEQYLGPRKYMCEAAFQKDQVGITNGLAWTSYGGEMLKIEAVLMPGTGKLTLTGQLGDVMKESAQAALSYARAHAQEFDIPLTAFTQHDLHIHVPAGAIPKDGPSAGITMLTSILSALTNRAINGRYAMTGELNLRGEVMPIGGVKEKILAAKRNKMSHIILPLQNKNDLIGIEEVAKDIDVVWVNHANEVMQRVLAVGLPQKRQRS
jgi:ATP-dependent Lon protease